MKNSRLGIIKVLFACVSAWPIFAYSEDSVESAPAKGSQHVEDLFGGSESTLFPPQSDESSKLEELNRAIDEELNQDPSNAKPQRNLGALELEEHLALKRFSKDPKADTRAMLVRTYERMALSLCFPPLAQLIDNISIPESPDCVEILNKLSALHSNNPILTCAKEGVESVECSQAFGLQKIRKYLPGEAQRLSLSEQVRDPLALPELRARFSSIQAKLTADIKVFEAGKSIRQLKVVEGSLFPMLTLICRDDAIELSLQQVAVEPTMAAFDPQSRSLASAIAALEAKKLPATPTPEISIEDQGSKFFRTRILPDRCFDTISDALDLDGRLPSATCFRDGFIAPSCLSALRRFLTLRDPPNSDSSVEGQSDEDTRDGLATF